MPQNPETWASLIVRLNADQDAWGIRGRYTGRLFIDLPVAGAWQHADAEDLTQQVMAAAGERRDPPLGAGRNPRLLPHLGSIALPRT